MASDQLNCGGDSESPSSSRLRATDSAYQVPSGASRLSHTVLYEVLDRRWYAVIVRMLVEGQYMVYGRHMDRLDTELWMLILTTWG